MQLQEPLTPPRQVLPDLGYITRKYPNAYRHSPKGQRIIRISTSRHPLSGIECVLNATRPKILNGLAHHGAI